MTRGHGNVAVDPSRLHALLNDRLGDFEEFSRQIETWIAAG